MAVLKRDIWTLNSANHPEDDSSTSGGAVQTIATAASKATYTDPSTASTVDFYCDTNDGSATCTITGRSASGAIVSETETLSGTAGTGVVTALTLQRLLKGVKTTGTPAGTWAIVSNETPSAADDAQSADTYELQLASGDVTSDGDFKGEVLRIVTASTGANQLAEIIDSTASTDTVYIRQWSLGVTPTGTIAYSIAPGMVFENYSTPTIVVNTVKRPFYDTAAPATSTIQRHEKLHMWLSHATLDLTNFQITEGSGGTVEANLAFDVESSLGGSDSVANRLAVPAAGYTFDDGPTDGANSGTFTAGSTQGVWVEEDLASDDNAANSFYELTVTGSSV